MNFEKDLIECINDIFNTLDGGHTERVYQNALIVALEEKGYNVEQELNLNIVYKGSNFGKIRLDLLVDKKYIIELKAIESVGFKEVKQLQRYLSGMERKMLKVIWFSLD